MEWGEKKMNEAVLRCFSTAEQHQSTVGETNETSRLNAAKKSRLNIFSKANHVFQVHMQLLAL